MTGIQLYGQPNLIHERCLKVSLKVPLYKGKIYRGHNSTLEYIKNESGEVIGFRCPNCKREWRII